MQKKARIWTYAALAVFTTAAVAPLAYMFIVAFSTEGTILTLGLPKLTGKNYANVLLNPKLMRYILNSWILSTSTATLTVALASLTGYGLSRFEFRMKKPLIVFVLLTQMVPAIVVILGYFELIVLLDLVNTYRALIVLFTVSTLPLCILVIKSTFDTIPRAIDDAALIDGCSSLRTFLEVTIPLSASGLFAAWVISFVITWTQYLYALVFITDYRIMPVTVGLANQIGQHRIRWSEIMALTSIAVLPVIIIFSLTQKIFLRGLTGGAVKG